MELDSPSPSPSPPKEQTSTSSTFTPAERIAELNSVDSSLTTLLDSASTAISVLSNFHDTPSTEAEAQQKFQAAASTYFSTLSSIEVRLRRQVYALEEAGLIPAGDERDARRGRNLNEENTASRRVGEGPLDPSWLNARVSDGVERSKRRELLDMAKKLVQETEVRVDKIGMDVKMEDSHDND